MPQQKQYKFINQDGANVCRQAELAGVSRREVISIDFSQIASIADVLIGPTFPKGFVCTNAFCIVDVAFVAADVTTKIGLGFAVDAAASTATCIIQDAAISGAPWSTTGSKACIPINTAATILKCTGNNGLTADRQLQVTRNTGAGALTAGHMFVVVEGFSVL